MHPFSFILSALFALTVVHAVPGGQPSNVPTCTYTCPPKDQANFSLGTHNDSNGILFCSYPISSRSEHSYHCIYSKSSGALTHDHDSGLCPNKAISSC
ncbi:hypothetical protein K443DRAFT_77394, partial [Laccaria amethystina LaAM-08-1]